MVLSEMSYNSRDGINSLEDRFFSTNGESLPYTVVRVGIDIEQYAESGNMTSISEWHKTDQGNDWPPTAPGVAAVKTQCNS